MLHPRNDRHLAPWLLLAVCTLIASAARAQCGTTVYDPGGTSNYGNNASFTVTYCPSVPGQVVSLNFTQFVTENNVDVLVIHNGNSTSAPVLGTFSGTRTLGTITSTSPDGCLTLSFTSDGSFTYAGWTATVSCAPPANPCGTTVYDGGGTSNYPNSSFFLRTYCPDVPGEAVTLNFSAFATEACCDFLQIFNGSSTAAPLIASVSGTLNLGSITSSSPDGCLTLRFTADITTNAAGWTAAVTCAPRPDPCGTTVSDPGGPAGNYPNNAFFLRTYCPSTPGEVVTLTFSQFATELNNDVLFIYNGPNTSSPLLANWSGTVVPAPVTSTAPDGCLTVLFRSNASTAAAGWQAVVNCTPPPPPASVCGTTFTDPGGPGNYANNTNVTRTFCPDSPGQVVSLSFSQFATEVNNDVLYVFDGPDVNAPLLGAFSGTSIVSPLFATNPGGCLTVRFVTNTSTVAAGFTATVNCVAPPAPTIACGTTIWDTGGAGGSYANNQHYQVTYCPANPGDVVTLNFSQFATESCCDFLTIHDGPSMAAPVIGTFSGSSILNPIYATNPSGCLTIRFRSDGSTTGAGWAAAVTCGPPPPPVNACGTTIHDTGGAGGNYGNNQHYQVTYCPPTPGDVVTLNFSSFATESCCDRLTIHNGPTLNDPVLGTFSGTNNPGTFISTHPSGCLTLRFVSDGSVTAAGWAAAVTCGTAPDCILVLTLNDSWGDGWGTSSVDVSVNGSTFTPYSLTGAQRTISLPVNVGDQVVLSYNASGTFQDENSYSVAAQGGGGLFFSGTPPAPGISLVHTVDCIPPPAPQEDCVGAFTICNDLGFNNNTNNTGFVSDLSSVNWGCITSGEHQGTWYVFSPSSSGNLGFTITPQGTTDYDWALWGPYPPGTDLGAICPPPGQPIRCAASSGPATFANTGSYATGMGHAVFSPPQFAGTNLTYSIPATTNTCPLAAPQRCGWIPGLQVFEGQVYLLYIDNWDRSGLAFDLSWTLESGASLDCTVLPVALLDLRATAHGPQVWVEWTAGQDERVDRTLVERSNDGTTWRPLGMVPAQPHTAPHHRWVDELPARGWNHYRLQQLGTDGRAAHSRVESVYMGHGAAASISPNPAGDHAELSLAAPLPPGSQLRLLDAAGRTALALQLADEGTRYALPLATLRPGVYTVVLEGPAGERHAHVRLVRH